MPTAGPPAAQHNHFVHSCHRRSKAGSPRSDYYRMLLTSIMHSDGIFCWPRWIRLVCEQPQRAHWQGRHLSGCPVTGRCVLFVHLLTVLQRVVVPLVAAKAFDIYRQLRLTNPSPYMFFFDFGDFQVVWLLDVGRVFLKCFSLLSWWAHRPSSW